MSKSDAEFPSVMHRYTCKVRCGDCNSEGIVSYETYCRWFEEASRALFASVGYTASRFDAERIATPMIDGNVQFLHPARRNDGCEVRSRIVRFMEKSFTLQHDVARADGTIVARATETRAWVQHIDDPNLPTKAQTISEELKALFHAK